MKVIYEFSIFKVFKIFEISKKKFHVYVFFYKFTKQSQKKTKFSNVFTS